MPDEPSANAGRPIRTGLWIAQTLLTLVYVPSGFAKLLSPIAQLSSQLPWTGEVSAVFVRSIGVVDLAGGVGILLPSLLRVTPQLTTLAALGCSVLQVLAMAFHFYRGEFEVLLLNSVLLGLSLFVFWGRAKKAPIVS